MDRRSASFRGGNEAGGWRTGRRGFSLIELMLVVTLLAIILAMAIPAFVSSRKHANEVSAISSLRTLSSIQFTYRNRFGVFGSLADLITARYVDDSFSDGMKSGYRFASNGGASAIAWAVSAGPIAPGVSGDRWFYVDETGVIHVRDGAAATPADPAIQ